MKTIKTLVFLLAVAATGLFRDPPAKAAEVSPAALTPAPPPAPRECPLPARAPWHSLMVEPDANLTAHIHIYDKLNPIWWLRNLAEPVAPAWYKAGDPHRNVKYHLRNPGANFCRYVIGIADKEFVRSGRHPDVPANPHGGLNFAISRRGLVVLPYLDYRFKKFEVYFGWRDNGSFGVACRRQPFLD